MIETGTCPVLPGWVPEAARHYLVHTEFGRSLRDVAREAGCHASTVMRQVRRTEARRDDPLVDEALDALATPIPTSQPTAKEPAHMSAPLRHVPAATPDDATVEREARRVLRRLNEPGACLAVARDLEKAAVVREMSDGRTARTCVIDRSIARAMALKDWIVSDTPLARIARYRITQAGRAALKRLLDEDEARGAGFAEAQAPFGDQHRDWDERTINEPGKAGGRRLRYNSAESPVVTLARRRDKDGKPFLNEDLVAAADRLRLDFELAQMGPRVAQNWDRFLTGGERGGFSAGAGPADGPQGARDRVSAALRDLGPGLGDVALRCCCFLEGLETAEKRMGWSARSGKIVLRIALQRLKQHYDEVGEHGKLMG